MKSKSENFCKSKFDEFIRNVSPYSSIHWEDVLQKDEPPDYFLHLDNVRYAVEVTILMEKTRVGNSQLPKVQVVASLWNLVDEVERNARFAHSLHGAYLVSFSQPISNLRETRDQIFNDLLSYVKATKDASSAPAHIVYKNRSEKCTIKKLHDQKNYIGKVGPSGAKWEIEILDEICGLLEERIASKHHKLRKVAEPKILLLHDSYLFADAQAYKKCISKISTLASFHTIFVIQGENGFILNSLNARWS